MTATEIGLARDAGARRRAAAAMRAVVTTRDHAKQTVALAETFWAWMRSVLELDEKEKKARRISGEGFPKNVTNDETRRGETKSPGTASGASFSHRTRRRSDDPSSLVSSHRRVAELKTVALRLGPTLRRRRRDVETVARMWRSTRETSRSDPERSAALSALAAAAAARTPSLASFEAGARAKLTVETVDTVDTVETREKKEDRSGCSSDFASARSPDDAPAPPGVAEALALRRATRVRILPGAAGGEDGTSVWWFVSGPRFSRLPGRNLPRGGARRAPRRRRACAIRWTTPRRSWRRREAARWTRCVAR